MNTRHGFQIGLLSFLLLTQSVLGQSKEKPAWIKQRPISRSHYIGIGMAKKSGGTGDYIQIAKDNALNDLASQIKVQISSEVVRKVIEKAGVVAEDFRSLVQSSTKAELEGYELVDTWENDREYWVYYRLSRALYEKMKREKIAKAVSLALDTYSKALENQNQERIGKAILFYLQSLLPVEKYAAEPLEVDFQGKTFYLMNEIYASLQNLLSKIELRPERKQIAAKIGQPLAGAMKVSALFTKEQGVEVPVVDLPVRFSFVRGAGEIIEQVRTDRAGRASTRISKITATDRLQIVRAQLDLPSFIPQDTLSLFLSSVIHSLPAPSTTILLNVSGLSVFLQAEEKLFGHPVAIQHIEPELKKSLAKHGFVFLDTQSDADLYMVISAEAKQGSEMYGMFSAFADLTISVLDLTTGAEIYKGSLHDVKGIDLTYEKGGLKALENAAHKVEQTLLPEIIRRIQK